MTKVEYTSCPITILILQNKPNFPHFSPKIEESVQKQTQNEPKRTQTYTVWAIWATFGDGQR
jgi:hypothetical protein